MAFQFLTKSMAFQFLTKSVANIAHEQLEAAYINVYNVNPSLNFLNVA